MPYAEGGVDAGRTARCVRALPRCVHVCTAAVSSRACTAGLCLCAARAVRLDGRARGSLARGGLPSLYCTCVFHGTRGVKGEDGSAERLWRLWSRRGCALNSARGRRRYDGPGVGDGLAAAGADNVGDSTRLSLHKTQEQPNRHAASPEAGQGNASLVGCIDWQRSWFYDYCGRMVTCGRAGHGLRCDGYLQPYLRLAGRTAAR